ncbi:MAG: glycosyltransferase family 2 protein [Lachnospiraceae bacterium]|nr:glycosyltransferase family 2 protein [Lachnospiraceae bacterium]
MTVSVCMIVKNEEAVLARCLDCLTGIADEIIIVDTGSVDSTKSIAAKYTDKIYDFEWVNDFAAARNFAFSLATMDYIYSADADEIIDDVNIQKFRILKASLLPEIEIVQMKYGNQLENGTVYNFDEEYRPKLFKRVRNFTWIEPVHEQVRLDPVVFDSDIVITHKPHAVHAARDIAIFKEKLEKGEELSPRLWDMFAKELFIAGSDEELVSCSGLFKEYELTPMDENLHQVVCTVAARASRIAGDATGFFKYAVKVLAGSEGCSEVCYEMGLFYEKSGDLSEAFVWFYNAAYETEPVIRLSTHTTEPIEHLIKICEASGNTEQAVFYKKELEARKMSEQNVGR